MLDIRQFLIDKKIVIYCFLYDTQTIDERIMGGR